MTEFALQNDTLQTIQTTAVKASGATGKVVELRPTAEPEEVYYLISADGKAERKVAEPKPRDHALHSLDQVPLFVERFSESDLVVWYSEDAVVVIIDDGTRRDRATLTLNFTSPLQRLVELTDDQPVLFSQREFVRLLRIELAPCLTHDRRLLSAVRECDFTARAATSGSIQHGRESLGSDIENAVVSKSADGIPEDVDLSVRVFTDPSLLDTQPVKCFVAVHPQEGRFELVPEPMAVRKAIDFELDTIVKILVDDCPDGTPIFRGTP